MNSKLRKLQSKVLRLTTEQRAAFDAAVLMGRGFTPSRVLDATEWATLWGIHSSVTGRKLRSEIEDLVEEVIPLKSAEYVLVTGPKTDSWIVSIFKKTLAVAGIIALAVSLVVAGWFAVSTVINSVSLNKLANTDGLIIQKMDENKKALQEGIDSNSAAIAVNTEDIKGIKADIEGIKEDVKKVDAKADSAVKKADDAAAKDGSSGKTTGTAGNTGGSPSDQTIENTKLIQTLVGAEPDGVIGDETKKAVEEAAKILTPSSTPTPSPTPVSPTPTPASSLKKPEITFIMAEAEYDGADITAVVNPGGAETHYYVEYGATTAYGSQTVPGTITDVANEKGITIELNGLASGKKFYYRLVVSNVQGSNNSGVKNFTTSTASPTPTPGSSDSTVRIVGFKEGYAGSDPILTMELAMVGANIVSFTYELNDVLQPWQPYQGGSTVLKDVLRPTTRTKFCPVVKLTDGTITKGEPKYWGP